MLLPSLSVGSLDDIPQKVPQGRLNNFMDTSGDSASSSPPQKSRYSNLGGLSREQKIARLKERISRATGADVDQLKDKEGVMALRQQILAANANMKDFDNLILSRNKSKEWIRTPITNHNQIKGTIEQRAQKTAEISLHEDLHYSDSSAQLVTS